MKFWQATLKTHNFSFEAFGVRKSDALMALGDAMRVHGEKYNLESDWADIFGQDIEFREIEFNVGYCDRHRLVPSG